MDAAQAGAGGKAKANFTVLRARLWENKVLFFTLLPSASLCQQLLA